MFSESCFKALEGTWWKVDSAAGGWMLTAAAIETLRGPEGPDPGGHPDGQLGDLSSSHIGAGVMFTKSSLSISMGCQLAVLMSHLMP